ncbi:MAG TPA: hypothetical protein VMZ71_15610 [Gemmataceae bacterium]|nr:hypothetical protein [Gemmataceae bacterium]
MQLALALSALFAAVDATRVGPPDVRRQQELAVWVVVKKLGGEVLYDYQRPNPDKPNVFADAKPKNPDAFHRVVAVYLRDTRATDDDLRVISNLYWLENLDLTNTWITDDGLAHLKGMKNLRVLCLWKTQVGDAGVAHLRDLTKMWLLTLDGTKVTDTGLAHLRGMTGLQDWLGLSDTRVSDAGLKHLEGFTKVRSLTLFRTAATADGVKKLRAALPKTDVAFDP